MKKLLILFALLFTLIGCGGGGGGSGGGTSFSGSFPTDSFSGTSYDMWSYVVPSTNTTTNSISSNSIEGTTYSATFRTVDQNSVEETPENTTGEKIRYTKYDNNITISFYKDGTKYFSYALKTGVRIGEQTTKAPSACLLVKHYYSVYLNGTTYSDIIEIDCGKHKGYYQKGKGQVYSE